MVTRLPMHLPKQVAGLCVRTQEPQRPSPYSEGCVEFVNRAAAVMSDPVYGSASMRSKRVEKIPTRATYAATADVRCSICDEGEHSVSQCRRFLSMNANDRLDIALKCQICFMCLTPGHITRECSNPVKCQERRCGQRHATILHDADWEDYVEQVRRKGMAKLAV